MSILRLSPVAVYDNLSSTLADTDLGSILNFIGQMQEYRRSFIGYLNGQKAFSSEQWFRCGDRKKEYKLGLSGLPIFEQRRESIASSFNRGTTDILLLAFFNVVCFVLSYTSFMRREVK